MPINKVGSKGIVDGSVATADFPDCTVTSDKLTDGTVANAKLVNSSFTLAGQSISLGGSIDTNLTDWQSVITADGSTTTTAVSGQGYFIDTTSASHTINLPASASIGDFVAIKDYAGTFGTNNLTVGRNGHNIQGVANDSLISTNRASLVLVYVDATKGWLYWEESNVADLQGPVFITATGGTVTTSGDFKIHTFTGDGCFVVSSVGSCAPRGDGPAVVDYLVVAGGAGAGAGSGSTNIGAGAGGGAGGYRESHSTPVSGCYTASPLANPTGLTISATTYPVTVGGGGAQGGNNPGGQGSNSVFSTITSTGGGGGGGNDFDSGDPGGSGGGKSINPGTAGSGNTPPVSPPQGNPGGATSPAPNGSASGGGGAGAAGGNGTPSGAGGPGGNGVSTSITGSSVAYAGGGGGRGNNGTGGTGGSGGGGNAARYTADPGVANTGGGAGAGCFSGTGTGGKGIVIIRYKYQ